jgi:hypothetical protein
MGHSLLALIQTHAEPNVETLAGQIEEIAEAKTRRFDAAQSHSLRMAEMYQKISDLLELLHDRILNETPARPEPIEPLAQSMTAAFGELQQQLQASEERQLATIENTFKHWESKRESESAGQTLQMESSHVQAQIEVNRLLRVMWLGTGLAAAGAGLALFLLSN